MEITTEMCAKAIKKAVELGVFPEKTNRDDLIKCWDDIREILESAFENEPVEKTGEECHFECEKYGLPKDSGLNSEVCNKCSNTPPF